MSKIIVTGADGRFGRILQKLNTKFLYKNKRQLNILSERSIKNNLTKHKPTHILHLAGLSRPMNIHEKEINKITQPKSEITILASGVWLGSKE